MILVWGLFNENNEPILGVSDKTSIWLRNLEGKYYVWNTSEFKLYTDLIDNEALTNMEEFEELYMEGFYYKEIPNLPNGKYIALVSYVSEDDKILKHLFEIDTKEEVQDISELKIKVNEMHKLHALDSNEELIVSKTERIAGSIKQQILTNNGITTVKRVE